MADATITSKSWGYSLTGGTDATAVTTGKTALARAVCTGTASAGTVTIADSAGTTIAKATFTTSLYENIDFGSLKLDGITVTLSATGSICNLIVI